MSGLRFILFLLPLSLFAQGDPVVYSLYFTGNTGMDTMPAPAVQLLAFESFNDSLSTILMLGNASGKDISKKTFQQRAEVIRPQLELFSAYQGKFFMLAGEAEWNGSSNLGGSMNLQCSEYINEWLNKNSIIRNSGKQAYSTEKMPELIHLNKGVSLIIFDSQWWLQSGIVFGKRHLKKDWLNRLDSLCRIATQNGDLLLMAAHHSLISNGKRIHNRQPLRFLFNFTPLKLASLAGLTRWLNQDLNQPRYRSFRNRIQKVIEKYPGLIYLSSHEYNMQYMVSEHIHHVISGSGAGTRQIDRYKYPARFMDDQQTGFFRICLHRSGQVSLHAYSAKVRGEYWKSVMFTHPLKFKQ